MQDVNNTVASIMSLCVGLPLLSPSWGSLCDKSKKVFIIVSTCQNAIIHFGWFDLMNPLPETLLSYLIFPLSDIRCKREWFELLELA